MSVCLDDGVIRLDGDCPIDDAETLLSALLEAPGAAVDWRACDQIHTAVAQVLMAARPKLIGPPRGQALSRWIGNLVGSTTLP